jgi:isochorismate hydrolase
MSSTFFPPSLSPFALTGVLLDARPEPITIDPERAVLLVIDMHNDFGSKGGMFDRAGTDISQIQKAAARRAGMKVIYLKMGFAPTYPMPVLRILQTG